MRELPISQDAPVTKRVLVTSVDRIFLTMVVVVLGFNDYCKV
jgi:hypothetical protein